jgi:hypothetical protein
LTKAKNTAPVVKDISKLIPRTDYPALNDVILALRKAGGNTDVPRFEAALETLASNYGTALGNGNSVLTDFQTKRAQELISKGFSDGQIDATIDQMIVEMDRELKGTQEALPTFLGGHPGAQAAPQAPAAPQAAPQQSDPLGIR